MEGLLSVSFGTSHADTRAKTIDAVDSALAAAFPERSFCSAWTSERIISKVFAERGERHLSIREALDRLAAEGVDDLVVATTCLMQGRETEKIEQAVSAWVADGNGTVRLSAPLLATEDDRAALARALAREFAWVGPEDALLLMGHGSPFGGNRVYSDIEDALHALGAEHFHVATVEGSPAFEDALAVIRDRKPNCVHLAPLMMVAGDHAKNDLAGPEEDSWARRLEACGFETNAILKGLGEYAAVRELVCEHARNAETLDAEGMAARG